MLPMTAGCVNAVANRRPLRGSARFRLLASRFARRARGKACDALECPAERRLGLISHASGDLADGGSFLPEIVHRNVHALASDIGHRRFSNELSEPGGKRRS